ncbi:cellular morphogenesis protein [Mucor ambiguus]|uniref:Cellular morphogenesis protein n=1 Tax=Mucor ambiguus TaxID=91626 RepID=A0A0C9N187_9FUNG|nr:cellular morphogenesis protein [Mucor ambiguus]
MVWKRWSLYFIVTAAMAAAESALPEIQLESVGGQLGFAGDFAGLSPYRLPSQFESLETSSLILSDMMDDTTLFQSFAIINGSIETYCQLTDNEFILAGNFISINETTYNHIARFNSQSRQLSSLDQGLDGAVKSVYCTSDAIYAGGDFMAPVHANMSQYTGHAAVYANNQWSPLPWKGFNGPVYSIIQHAQQNAIVFGGQFDSTGDGQYANPNASATTQMVNLDSSVTISSGNGASGSDPRSVICNQAPWELQGGNPGYWQAHIISLGSNQYFNLSYQDPITNQISTCSEACPLSNNSSIPYQDFTVVSSISTSGIRINIDTWYGSAGGLSGVSIYRSDATLQPNVVTNSSVTSSSCSAAEDTAASSASVSTTGTWTSKYSWGIYQTFLVSVIPASELHTADVSATYKPFIPVQSVYDVYATTPGCVGTSTCDQRVLMQLTIELTPGNTTTVALDQNINSDQRTLIYRGPVSASTSTFQPSIVMKVDPAATTSSSSNITIIGTSIEFARNATGVNLSSVLSYYPSNNTWNALAQQLPAGSIVHSLASIDSTLYMGGQFVQNTTFSNVVAYDFGSSALKPLAQSGVNGAVHSLLVAEDARLFVAGAFNNTAIPQANSTLNHVAIYNTQFSSWSDMHQGVNGPVNSLYATKDKHVHLSGPFNATTTGTRLYNNAEWDASAQSWVGSSSYILGPVSNQVQLSDTATLYLGSIQNAQSYRASNTASLASQGMTSAITDIDPNAIVYTGAFWKSLPILAGSFKLNNTTFPLVIYSENAWQGLLPQVQGNITTLSVVQNSLLMGGRFNGTTDDNVQVASIAFYDLENKNMQAITGIFDNNQQPGTVHVIHPLGDGKSVYVGGDFAFAGMLNCDGLCVLSLETRQWTQPNQGISGTINDMYIDDTTRLLTVVGNLTVNQNTPTSLASIDTSSNTATWTAAPLNEQYTSPSALLYDSDNQFLLTGSKNNATWVAKWDGHSFSSMDTTLDASSAIHQLLWIPITSDSAASISRYPSDSDTMLMAVGHLVLPNLKSSCSAALFDGSTWHPYLLSATSTGSPGRISGMFTATACCNASYKTRRYLSVPAVILISIAISLGILFLLIACAFVYMFLKRRHQPPKYYADPMKEWRPKYRPTSLLAMLDAANLNGTDTAVATAGGTTLAGAGAMAAGNDKQADAKTTGYSTALDDAHVPTHRGQTSMDMSEAAAATARYRNSSGFSMGLGLPFSVLMANALRSNDTSSEATEDAPKVYYAKYPFDAKEFGELAFDAQTPIVVTDTSDNVWWMGYKDDGSGNPVSGLFPSNYVTKAKPF